MKTLLRTLIIGLLVFAGYAAFATSGNPYETKIGGSPTPCGPSTPGGAFCAR